LCKNACNINNIPIYYYSSIVDKNQIFTIYVVAHCRFLNYSSECGLSIYQYFLKYHDTSFRELSGYFPWAEMLHKKCSQGGKSGKATKKRTKIVLQLAVAFAFNPAMCYIQCNHEYF
jgi:hypothetical protein